MITPTHIDTEAQRLRTDRRAALLAALDLHRGDRRLAAAALGISERQIYRWQEKLAAGGELEARAKANAWLTFADHGRKGMASRWARPAAPVLTDAARLTQAMKTAGIAGMSTVDRAAGVAKGTVRLVLHGGAALASAGGGKLLAWVERIEAGERSGGT